MHNTLCCYTQGKPLDASQVRQFGLVLSRFEYNGFPNESFRPGRFSLAIEYIGAYRVSHMAWLGCQGCDMLNQGVCCLGFAC